MTTHAVLVPNMIAAMNIDSLNRSAQSASDVDNGNIVILTSRVSGQPEVFTAVVPSTANGLTGVWIAYDPEIVLTAAKYKGIDPDPRNYYNEIGKTFSVFKPQIGDIITLTAEALAGSKDANTFANATDTTGGLKPLWGATQTASVFSLKLLATTYISIADGSIGNQRVTAYQFEVVGI